MEAQTYRIALKYREPYYELKAGTKTEPYSGGTSTITAPDAVEALRIALDRFDAAQRLSGVGWRREVVRIEIDVVRAPDRR